MTGTTVEKAGKGLYANQATVFESAAKDLYFNLVVVTDGLSTMEPSASSAWIEDQYWPTAFEDYLKAAVAKRKAYYANLATEGAFAPKATK